MPGLETAPSRDDRDLREHRRVRDLYERHYEQDRYRRLWSGPAIRYIHQEKWVRLRPLLAGLVPAGGGARVLDLGAGAGVDCVEFAAAGFDPARLVALDLVARDLRAGRDRIPRLGAAVGDASRLPIRDASIDLVFQSTMISSVLDPALRASIYAEAARVLRRGGAFVSFDMRYPNPWNRNTRPVRVSELRRAFPGWRLEARSLTLLPPLIRLLLPLSAGLCRAAERVPVLRSHLLAWAIRP